MKLRPRTLFPAVAVATVLMAWIGSSAAQGESLEEAVKATFVYKFAPFVKWPEGAFESPESPVRLCIVGDDQFAELVVGP